MFDRDVTDPEFFVGYLPTPPRLRRFLWLWAMALMALALAAAVVLAMNMRDPGDGYWALNGQKELEGIFLVRPYPMLALLGERAEDSEMLLVVNQGKLSAPAAQELDGRRVRVNG